MAGRVLLALYSLFYLLGGVLCQEKQEQALRCFQTSTSCSDGNEEELPYSECCAIASAAFMINDTCYECSGLLSFTAPTYEVGEGDRYVSVGVRRRVNPGTNIFFFSAVINDGTAKAGIDYGQFPDSGVGFIHVILVDESQVDAGIVILDDNIVEYNENFTVSLQPLSSSFQPLGDPQDIVEVTITDDDKVDISLSPRGPLVVNESSSLVFLLNKTGLADRAVQVTVDLSDPELEFGDGAPPSIRTFTFEPNDPPKQIEVVVRDDEVVEATEDHLIFLRVPEGETGVNLPRDSETLRVQDDGDSVQLSLPPPGSAALTVEESRGEVRIPLLKTGFNERPVLVRVFTQPVSATAGEDYSPIDAVLEVQPTGDVFININVSADGAVEDLETFRVILEVPEEETGVLLGVSTAMVTIINNDILTVDVSPEALTVTEGETVSFLVSGGGATLQRDVVISLSSSNDRDIILSTTTVTLTPGQLETSVTVTGLDDDLYEGAESAQLVITSSDIAVLFSSPSPTIDVEIVDNDSPQLSFSQEVYSFNENQTLAEISVSFNALTETTHSWTLTSVPLTATEGEDYMSISRVLTFSDSVRFETVPVFIFDDLLSEGIESFRLELRDSNGELTNGSLVEILDDEKLEITFTNETVTVSEGDGFFYLTIVKSGVTTSDITVDLNITDGSARGGVDYGFFPTAVFPAVTLILADETSVRFPILIRNDDIVEITETFNVALLIKNSDGTVIAGDVTRTMVLIEDDDKVRVLLEGGGVEVEEGGSEAERTVQFTVTRDANVTLDRDILVSLSTSDGSATVGSGDYSANETTFTFSPAGPVSFSETVQVLDDNTVENRERFFVGLSAPAGETALNLPENPSVVYIADNDNIQVDFVDSIYTVSEGDGVVSVLLNKIGENEIPVVVSVVTETRDDTAIAGRDYNATIEPVEFPSAQTQVAILIPILDDGALESEEGFTVVLSTTGTDENVVLGPRNTARVTITDDDSVFVEFEEAAYTGIEGGDVSVSVLLRGSTERTVEVGFTSLVGTADESDFSPQSGSITFSPGETSGSVLVTLSQDSMCDDDEETFSLLLESSDPNVRLGPRSAAEVFITDDDECTIQFMNDTVIMVLEEDTDSQITLCIGIGGDLILDREVRFAVVAEELTDIPVDQQALLGVDFVFNPIIRVLQPSENQICFNVTILGDDRREDLKKFNVSVFPEDEELRSSRAEVTVAIISNMTLPPPTSGLPTVEFSLDVYSVGEDAGFVEIVLTISPAPTDTEFLRSVLFSTADGTATAPDDYAAQEDTSITIEGSSATVLVEIVEDNLSEGQESFSVSLTLPDTANVVVERVALGVRTAATVVIRDAGDVFVDDTVTGDPFFIVPLSLTPNSQSDLFQENQVALCYEIHGIPGANFNLVSDTCTSVNALYSISSVNPELNFISGIGVRAVDVNRNCVDIRVSVAQNCTPEIRRGNDDITALPRFASGGIVVRKTGESVRISVPNCANTQLVMWVKCREVNNQPQLRFDITRGFNLDPTSHGLLGQFWNIPVTVTHYTFPGPVVYDLQSQDLYRVDILSPSGSEVVRQFVAEFGSLSWDHNRPESCLYAGDQQGGRTLEFASPNDPVIENNYRLYKTGGLFSTGFRFSKFNEAICGSG